MEEQFYTILTSSGKAKIANSNVLGSKLNLAKFQVGDGGGAYYNPTEDQTQLKNKVWEGNINSIRADKDNPNWIVIEVVIPTNEGGFMIREAGIVDADGDLIAIGKYPETFKPHIDNGSSKDLFMRMILEISNTENVTLKVDSTVIMATRKDVEVLESKLKVIKDASTILRGVIPSGFIKLNDIDYAYCSNNPNKIKLNNEGLTLVNGWKIVIADGTIIDLGEPPVAGEREDFIFLECWFDAIANELQHRIRCVNGVDFSKTPNGFRTPGELWKDISVFAQGGNDSVVTDADLLYTGLTGTTHKGDNEYRNWENFDNGLYISGDGTQKSRNILKTNDGYVYAIPMFKIRRRNSSSYSEVNPNGASELTPTNVEYNVKYEYSRIPNSLWILELDNVNGIKIGDYFTRKDLVDFKCNDSDTKLSYGYLAIVENIEGNIVTFRDVNHSSAWNLSSISDRLEKVTKVFSQNNVPRFDCLSSNIISPTDIINLRHKISLNGFDYNYLLDENFDLVLRDKLQTNAYKDTIKTYHGIKKTPIDSNTIFYCSFDGTTIPEVGGTNSMIYSSPSFDGYASMDTGLGIKFNQINLGKIGYKLLDFTKTKAFSIDFTLKPKIDSDKSNRAIFTFDYDNYIGYSPLGNIAFYKIFSDNIAYKFTNDNIKLKFNEINKIRITYDINNNCLFRCYINGIKCFEQRGVSITSTFNTLYLGFKYTNSPNYYNDWIGTISDLAISNIDRGDVFQTLPKDFIKGYAKISEAFTEQRQCFSDALSSEYKTHVIKSGSSGNYPNEIKVIQNSKDWSLGDKIVIKGLGGELIMGLIDADIIEVTDNTSSPIIKYNGGVIKGAWSGIGTSEAIFTFGNNPNLINQDVQIEYNLVESEGQGGFNDIPSQIFGAEINDEKLIVSSLNCGPHVIDDFKGKKKGSFIENPHIAKFTGSPNLVNPNSGEWAEFSGYPESIYQYPAIYAKDNELGLVGGVANGGRANILFSWNIIEAVERKYGNIPSLDKVKWCYDNISKICCIWNGYGVGPGGNKAHFSPWRYKTNSWEEGPWHSKDSLIQNYPKDVVVYYGHNDYFTICNYMDETGWVHFIAYAEIADEFIQSLIFTDYVRLEITLKGISSEYDILMPVNVRRDAGISNVLAIRKETNEIRNLYGPSLSNKSVITYANYSPYQGTSIVPKVNVYPLTDWKVIATTKGTGSYGAGCLDTSLYPGILNLPVTTRDKLYKFGNNLMTIGNEQVGITKTSYYYQRYGSTPIMLNGVIGNNARNDYKCYRGWKMDNYLGIEDSINGVYALKSDLHISTKHYLIASRLVVNNYGEIMMLVARSNDEYMWNDGGQFAAIDSFYLKDRPIIGGI